MVTKIVQVTDSSAIKQYKKLVRKCIEKRLVVTNLNYRVVLIQQFMMLF